MSITWTRHGYLGFMIPLAFWAVAAIIGGSSNFAAFRIALALAAVAVWMVGSRLNAEFDDDEPGHTAFGFAMQRSGLVICLIGFVLTFL